MKKLILSILVLANVLIVLFVFIFVHFDSLSHMKAFNDYHENPTQENAQTLAKEEKRTQTINICLSIVFLTVLLLGNVALWKIGRVIWRQKQILCDRK